MSLTADNPYAWQGRPSDIVRASQYCGRRRPTHLRGRPQPRVPRADALPWGGPVTPPDHAGTGEKVAFELVGASVPSYRLLAILTPPWQTSTYLLRGLLPASPR